MRIPSGRRLREPLTEGQPLMTTVEPLSRHRHDPSAQPASARDPVCGMTVDPATARHRVEHGGHRYVFCSARCREKFTAQPGRYITSPQSRGPAAAAGETLWTCPMHPQIVRKEPGNCPICGMALEPMTPGGETENRELRDMTRRFWAGVGFSVPLVVIATAGHFDQAALDAYLSPRVAVWVQLILGTAAVLWGGWPFFERGWASVVNRRLNMFTLIALGTGVAYFYSLVAALASRSKRSYWETSGASVPARRCRSTVSCSTGTAPSISR